MLSSDDDHRTSKHSFVKKIFRHKSASAHLHTLIITVCDQDTL